MTKPTVGAVILLICFVVGCASQRDPAGSRASAPLNDSSDGVLIVYSAPDPHPHFTGSPYNIRYSDYSICSADGTVLETVRNDTGTMLEGPAKVRLPAGKYEVKGRAATHLVTMPVEVSAHQVTTVHLN